MMQKLFRASLRKWVVAFGGAGIMLPLYLLLACCFGMAAVIVTAKAPARISAAVLDNCRGPYSTELADAVVATGDIEAIPVTTLEQGEDLLLRGRAEVLLIISPDYDAKILEDSSEKLITLRTAPGAVSANLLRETIAGILTARRNAARMRLELEEEGLDSSLLEPYSRELELKPLVESVTADAPAEGTGALFGTAYACYEGIAVLALLLLLLTISRRLRDEASARVSCRLGAVSGGWDLAFFSDAGALLLAGLLCGLLAFGIGPSKSIVFLAGLFCYTVCAAGFALLLSSFEAAGRIDLLAPFLALTTSILGGCFVDLTMVSDTFRTISCLTPQGQLIAAVRGKPAFLLVLLLEGIVLGGAARLRAGGAGLPKAAGRGMGLLLAALVLGIPAGTVSAAAAESAPVSSMEEINASLVPQSSEDFYRTTYEVFVYSFCDGDGDGIGDLKGLLSRLDTINDGDPSTAEDLGCTALWLMPVFPSPTYHKYDTVDYRDIDPEYGTLADMDALLEACHGRDMRVILDLAVNHTSSRHPWFRRAAEYLKSLPEGEEPSEEQCPEIRYYHFSREGGEGFAELPDSGWFYEARFWSEMPDLNLDCQAVRRELEEVLRFWLERGVDGFRLDAVPYYYTDSREASIAFTGWLTETAKSIKPDAYLVAEAWTDQDSYAAFYRSGIDSMFDFAFADREGIIARVAEGSAGAGLWAEAMEAEESLYASLNPAFINAPFYTNHDMARSAGYYNDRPLKRGEKRPAGTAGESAARTKLAEALNLLMTGNAFLYYGEELGMRGSGKDENKRAPMYWSDDPEAEGVCAGPPDMDEVEMKFGSWETQRQDPWSVYSYIRQAVRIRESLPVLARGKTRVLPSLSKDAACGFLRTAEGLKTALVLVNAGPEEAVLELPEEAAPYGALKAALLTSEGEIRREENRVTLPAFGIAVYTAE